MPRAGRLVVSLGPPAEFQRIISGGGRLYGKYAVLFFARSGFDRIRLGVSASGKAGSNVVRNRCKRLLREAVRQEAAGLGPGYDLVLIAKASAAGRGLIDIAADVRRLFSELASRSGLDSVGQGGAGTQC